MIVDKAEQTEDSVETWYFNHSTAWATDEFNYIDSLNYLREYIEGESGIEIDNSHSMKITIINETIIIPATSEWVYDILNINWTSVEEYKMTIVQCYWLV